MTTWAAASHHFRVGFPAASNTCGPGFKVMNMARPRRDSESPNSGSSLNLTIADQNRSRAQRLFRTHWSPIRLWESEHRLNRPEFALHPLRISISGQKRGRDQRFDTPASA